MKSSTRPMVSAFSRGSYDPKTTRRANPYRDGNPLHLGSLETFKGSKNLRIRATCARITEPRYADEVAYLLRLLDDIEAL